MTRDEINHIIADAAGVDVGTTERVLVALEQIVQSQMGTGFNKYSRVMALYQAWKAGS